MTARAAGAPAGGCATVVTPDGPGILGRGVDITDRHVRGSAGQFLGPPGDLRPERLGGRSTGCGPTLAARVHGSTSPAR
ncbi:hypothetical protein, partial [Streptomyces sp. NPDC127574]|uniref:hypothetical protein n=1 Tax=Streptomyces sp. NPDC127574 TaxID=3345401 RepID=UPI003645F246